MRIGLLGGLEVRDEDGRDVEVAGAKLRALLALLALHTGRIVPTDQLIEALWGEEPPSAVRNSLQGLASRLRHALGSTELVAMRGGGYVLELPSDAVDVHRYEQLIADGNAAAAAGDAPRAAALLNEGEALWRGDALADFTYDEFAAAPIRRLSEMRLAGIEERLDIELRIGGHGGGVVELEALVDAHPLRERLRGLLMLALYRSGRQADALRVFQEGRSILGDELGLEPGAELRRLEAAILAQDPLLDAPASATPTITTSRKATIPAALTPLVGREHELRELQRLATDHRLITLVGPGGVGKTCLAVEAGRAEAALLADGGCLVELAVVGDPAGVRPAIASALDLPNPNRLAELIGDREMLIVLDNCEHVIGVAAEVAEDLLRRCAKLRLLATSREGLRVQGEMVWPVPPLAPNDAVELFLARAEAAGAAVEGSDAVAADIADICTRLDGLPLAIELAAARTRVFPIQQISARLNDRFRLLTGGSRTALPRQQTLRAVVDWSYELLFDDEQRVFERLAVFPGGCDLTTAEAICADETLDAADVDDIIRALVDKSLVIAMPTVDTLRFKQLQTLAQYGREKLAERGDAGKIRDAMAARFAGLSAGSVAAYVGDGQRAWLIAMDHERDNVRAALEWAVANDDAETALTIAAGASWRHWLAGTVVEGKRWLDEAFACRGEVQPRTRALALTGRGLIDFQAGFPDRADADLEAALDIFREHSDVPAMVLAYSYYAEVAATRGDFDEARRRRLDLIALDLGPDDDPFVLARRVYQRGKLAVMDGDLGQAEEHYREAADRFGQIDRPMMRAMCLDVVADFDERAGNYAAAIAELREAIETNESLGLSGLTGAMQVRLGWVLLNDGDRVTAQLTYEHALDLARRLRHTQNVFLALSGLAALHLLNGRERAAREAATEALEIHQARGPRRFGNRIDPAAEIEAAVAACCTVLGLVAANDRDMEHAAHLLGHAQRLRDDVGVPIPLFQSGDVDGARGSAVAVLGEEGFARAFEVGRRRVLPLVIREPSSH